MKSTSAWVQHSLLAVIECRALVRNTCSASPVLKRGPLRRASAVQQADGLQSIVVAW